MPLLLVGVGHVFNLDAAIHALVAREGPQVVALELDSQRYHGLLRRGRGEPKSSDEGRRPSLLYRTLARFQEEVAQGYGVEVGSEMLAAIQAAHAFGAELALVDRPAQESVRRLWKEMPWRERLRLLWSGLGSAWPGKKGTHVEAEIQRYQADPTAYLDELGQQFPTVKRVLLTERNEFMAARLRQLARDRRVLAFVGDGHVDGLVGLLSDVGPHTVRLAELRRLAASAPAVRWSRPPGGAQVGFSFEQQSLEGAFRKT